MLLLTGIAEIAVSALRRERIEADRHFPPDVRRALNTIPVRTVLVYFLMAEATSLYALASDCSTTFLVVLCALATWAQVRAVVNLTLSRLKADPARGPLQLLGIPLQWVINVTIVNPFVALTGQLKAVGAKIALWVLERAQRILHRMFPDPDDDSAPPE